MFHFLLPLLLFLLTAPAVASIPTSTADGSPASLSSLTDNGTVVTSSATTYDAFGQRAPVREKIAAQDNQYRHVYNALGELRETHIGNPRQHPFGNTKGAGLTTEQRSDFNLWRTDYWKWRATEELGRR